MTLGGQFKWAIAFIGTFSVLIGTIPAVFLYTGQAYEELEYSEEWRAAQLFFGVSNTTAIPHDNATITRDSLGNLYISEHDIHIEYEWVWPLLYPSTDNDYITLAEWWYWYIGPLQFSDRDTIHLRDYDDDLIDKERVLDHILESNENLSSFEGYTLTTKHDYLIMFSFNNTEYSDFEDAWDSGELNLWVGINPATTESELMEKASMNAWALIGQLLLFQAPDMLAPGTLGILLNALIVLPIWATISYIAFALFMKLVHGGGD